MIFSNEIIFEKKFFINVMTCFEYIIPATSSSSSQLHYTRNSYSSIVKNEYEIILNTFRECTVLLVNRNGNEKLF